MCLVVLGLGPGGGGACRGEADAHPARTRWPTLTAYPGARVIGQQATPPPEQLVRFSTEATGAQLTQYYLDALGPQGWRRDATGGGADLASCPKLWLEITPIARAEARTTYRVTSGQEQCPTYC